MPPILSPQSAGVAGQNSVCVGARFGRRAPTRPPSSGRSRARSAARRHAGSPIGPTSHSPTARSDRLPVSNLLPPLLPLAANRGGTRQAPLLPLVHFHAGLAQPESGRYGTDASELFASEACAGSKPGLRPHQLGSRATDLAVAGLAISSSFNRLTLEGPKQECPSRQSVSLHLWAE